MICNVITKMVPTLLAEFLRQFTKKDPIVFFYTNMLDKSHLVAAIGSFPTPLVLLMLQKYSTIVFDGEICLKALFQIILSMYTQLITAPLDLIV